MELKGNYLDVAFMNDFQNAMISFWLAMKEAEYPSFNMTFEEVYPNYNPLMIQDLFNAIEEKMTTIDGVADWVNPYSGRYLWQKNNGAIFSKVERWVNWCNFNQEIISDKRQKSQNLQDINGEFIYDKNGEKIMTFEGYFKRGYINGAI